MIPLAQAEEMDSDAIYSIPHVGPSYLDVHISYVSHNLLAPISVLTL